MTRNVTVLLVLLTLVFSACSSTTTVRSTRRTASTGKPLPPGQAKKLNGDKSAKAYAPGQNKN